MKWLQILPTLEISPSLTAFVQSSCSVMSDSLQPHEPQQARPPCPSRNLKFTKTHVHWVGDAIYPSHPPSSPSPPALNLFQHQDLWVKNPQNFKIRLVIIGLYLAKYNRKICLWTSLMLCFGKFLFIILRQYYILSSLKFLWKSNFEYIIYSYFQIIFCLIDLIM